MQRRLDNALTTYDNCRGHGPYSAVFDTGVDGPGRYIVASLVTDIFDSHFVWHSEWPDLATAQQYCWEHGEAVELMIDRVCG